MTDDWLAATDNCSSIEVVQLKFLIHSTIQSKPSFRNVLVLVVLVGVK